MRFVKELFIAFLLCLVTVSAENITERTEARKVKTVSLCDGCMIGESCVAEGVQKQETLGGPLYYCGPNQKAELAKDVREICLADYECISYTCDEGYCDVKMKGEGISIILVGVLIGVVIILLIGVFLLFKLRAGVKKISEEEKKMEKEQKKPAWGASIKGIKQKPYRYRPEFDILEKKLKKIKK